MHRFNLHQKISVYLNAFCSAISVTQSSNFSVASRNNYFTILKKFARETTLLFAWRNFPSPFALGLRCFRSYSALACFVTPITELAFVWVRSSRFSGGCALSRGRFYIYKTSSLVPSNDFQIFSLFRPLLALTTRAGRHRCLIAL